MNGVKSFDFGDMVTQEIAERYASSKLGQRFAFTHQTPGTLITGQTAFNATTPTFIYHQAAKNEVVLSGITLTQAGVVAGDDTVYVAVAVDSTDRYASGGTAVAGKNMNAGSTKTPTGTFRTGATASAAGAGTSYLFTAGAPDSLGNVSSFDFGDGIIVPATGSILIYTWSATTGPSWTFSVEIVEFN